jgi:hypothetical protein
MVGSIDTLLAAKTLRCAGFDEAGAEAIVAVVRQASELPSLDHLATKDDLASVRHDLEKAVVSLKLFVASTVLSGAAMIVLAQIVTKAIGLAA